MLTSFADLNTSALFGLYCGIAGIVWTTILTDKGMIFNFIDKFLFMRLNTKKQQYEGNYSFLYKIVIGCERCFTGQLALWTFLYLTNRDVLHYSLMSHILCISTAITTVTLLKKVVI